VAQVGARFIHARGGVGRNHARTRHDEPAERQVFFNHVYERSEWYDMDTNGFVYRLRAETFLRAQRMR